MSISYSAQAIGESGFTVLLDRAFHSLTGLETADLEEKLLAKAASAPRDDHIPFPSRFRLHDKLVLLPWSGVIQRLPLPCYYRDLERLPESGRQYESFGSSLLHSSELSRLLLADLSLCPFSAIDFCYPVEVGLNLIRIVATPEQPGVSPPNKLHQDGEAFVIIHLLERNGIQGGESLVAMPDETPLWRGLLREPFDTLIVDDTRLFHHVDAMRTDPASRCGSRTVLVIDFSPMRSIVARL